MKHVTTIVAVLIISISVIGCSGESSCPVNVKSEYYFKKKVKYRPARSKGKPTPSLIHVTRVNYRPGSGK